MLSIAATAQLSMPNSPRVQCYIMWGEFVYDFVCVGKAYCTLGKPACIPYGHIVTQIAYKLNLVVLLQVVQCSYIKAVFHSLLAM